MITLGVDAHKRTHTIVAVDDRGRPVGQITVGTTSQDHLELLRWASRVGAERRWAAEDCRHLSRRLERDLLAAAEPIVRVPPKLMAHSRDSARTYGTAPLPVWSSSKARHRLSRTGNRQLNAALHRIALTTSPLASACQRHDRTTKRRRQQRTRGPPHTQASPLRCGL